jgi:beta-xylosidase
MRFQLAWIALVTCVDVHFSESVAGAPLPVIEQDFPDPSIINVDDQWYAFATQGNGKKVQIAQTKVGDLRSWKLRDEDALPNAGEWSTGTNIWAPQVLQVVGLLTLSPSFVTDVTHCLVL